VLAVAIVLVSGIRPVRGADPAGGVVRAEGPAVIRVPTAALLLSGLSGGSIRAESLATPFPKKDFLVSVQVLVEVDGASLAIPEAGKTLKLDVFAYALAPDGQVVGSTAQSWSLDPEVHRWGLERSGLKIVLALGLTPPAETLRILVLDPNSDQFALLEQPLPIPPASAGIKALLVPWVLEPKDRWLVAESAAASAPGLDLTRHPVLAGHGLLPAARPVLEVGATARVYLLVRAPGPGPWSLTARFEHSDGSAAAVVPVTILERVEEAVPELSGYLAALEVPDLPPGSYLLRSSLGQSASEAVASPPLPVEIVRSAASPAPALWTHLEWAEEAPAAAIAPHPSRATTGRQAKGLALSRQEIQSGYREALGLLAAGERRAAADFLRDLEVRATASVRARALRDLERIEWDSAIEVVGESWECLLPVMLLHADLITDYRERSLSPLADHAIRMSDRLSTALAHSARSPEERADAARAVTCLAGHLQRTARLDESDELFDLAVKLEAGNEAAHLGLAVNHEQQGRYREVVDTLRRLVEAHPGHAEARLRLAVNLGRTGEPEEARELFDGLTGAESPDWIAILATQEVASLVIRQGRPDEAARMLGDAVRRWPQRPALRVQLAYLLDRQERPREAGQMIQDLLAGRGADGASPRYLYNRWPDRQQQEAERELAERADAWLAQLGRMLAEREGAGKP
jgi:tetratricopeptide (TPR) repeat protein